MKRIADTSKVDPMRDARGIPSPPPGERVRVRGPLGQHRTRTPEARDFARHLRREVGNLPMTAKRIQLELCTASAEDCLVAEQGGADRLELNSALLLGGLTPSLGTLREARRSVRIPIIVMIRPRPAGFCYSRTEFNVMQRDLEAALAEGADGIAFGILDASVLARPQVSFGGTLKPPEDHFSATDAGAVIALRQMLD